MQMCIGFLKLKDIEEKNGMSKHLTLILTKDWNEHLLKTTEIWLLDHTNPSFNIKGWIILKFLSKLKIPCDYLSSWLTEKHLLFQKGSDLLYDYIESNWGEVGGYLISKTPSQP